MKDHGVKKPWTKELDIKVDLHLGCGSSTQVLKSSKERKALLLQNRLQAHIPGRGGFMGVGVDGIPSLIDASYLYVPSFVSLKDVFGGQNLKSGRSEESSVREAGELQQPAPNETKPRRTCNLKDQSVISQRGPGNVKANAADYGNAEAAQRNLLYKANGLDQGNVQSKAAVVEHKQQGDMKPPKKAKTTDRVQPIEASASQMVPISPSLSQSTQPSVSLPLTGNQFIHPTTVLKMKTKPPSKSKRAPEKK
ncbi:hypothetical protein RchiOBHm_Chr4g0412771 [Rosa chinensis]|uniref:Uncharacterized protein n=1 Tax=Rosa chinensis TaxID=74649 RepID=A0A2P6QVY9_ROSCH|nr:hypothetical protein RchiOBHm_Chr4g0412771 [Rosa chinensis]